MSTFSEPFVTTIGDAPIFPCDECHSDNANLRCTQCHTTYYCNVDCQRKHWKSKHKSVCKLIAPNEKELERRKLVEDFIKHYENDTVSTCPICFEPMEHLQKLQLLCHHVFCANCINSALRADVVFSCPLCRCQSKHSLFADLLVVIVLSFTHQACSTHPTSLLREHYGKYAREEYARCEYFLSISDNIMFSKSPQVAITMNSFDMDILFVTRQYQECFDASEKYLLSNPNYSNHDFRGYTDLFFKMLDCEIELGRERSVVKKLHDILRENEETFAAEPNHYMLYINHIYRTLSKALFRLQDYHEAIRFGEMAIMQRNNFIRGIHEIVARSFVGLGQIDKAIVVMRKGVRAEAPWWKGVIERNQDILQELLALQEEIRKD